MRGKRVYSLTELQERFWGYVEKKGDDDCWEWKGGKNQGGYGIYHAGHHWGIERKAHRFAWDSVNGMIPRGYELDHICRHRACCNLKHLQLVPKYWNGKQGIRHRREKGYQKKAFCVNGHPRTPENVYRRTCKICNLERMKAYQKRKRLKAAKTL
jgi:hypothetical protein